MSEAMNHIWWAGFWLGVAAVSAIVAVIAIVIKVADAGRQGAPVRASVCSSCNHDFGNWEEVARHIVTPEQSNVDHDSGVWIWQARRCANCWYVELNQQ